VDTVVYDTHNNAVTFTWHETFSLQDAPLSYEVVLFSGSQWDESHTVWRSPRTTDTSLTVTADDLPDDVSAGLYYWLVYVWDDNGNYNTSYNMDSFGAIYDLVNLP
jgi:hypothetical protein